MSRNPEPQGAQGGGTGKDCGAACFSDGSQCDQKNQDARVDGLARAGAPKDEGQHQEKTNGVPEAPNLGMNVMASAGSPAAEASPEAEVADRVAEEYAQCSHPPLDHHP